MGLLGGLFGGGGGSSQGQNSLVLPLEQQLTSLLSNRMGGIGPDLAPSFQAQRDFLGQQIGAQAEEQRRRGFEDIAATGGGRSGQTGALMSGIGRQAGMQRQGMETELGLAQQQAEQQAIQQAIQMALALQGQQSSNYFQQQGLNMQQDAQNPGSLELLGAGSGLFANLFGQQGAFPGVFGQGQDPMQNQLLTAQINALNRQGLPQGMQPPPSMGPHQFPWMYS
jgi:hypothetical protein